MVQVAGGFLSSLAVLSDGTVCAWGSNEYGQLGNATTTYTSVPIQVKGLTGVVAVAAGYGHSLALRNDGTVWAWGNDRPASSATGRPSTACRPRSRWSG